MRIDYLEWKRRYDAGEFVRVFLNGSDVTRTGCIFADDEAGIVQRYRRNEGGQLHLGEDGNIARETLHGHVEFVVEQRLQEV